MIRRLLLALGLTLAAMPGYAACPSLPFVLVNGTLADAGQVMANFNSIQNCVNNNIGIGVIGPSTSVIPDIPVFGNATGNLLTDSGAIITIGATQVPGINVTQTWTAIQNFAQSIAGAQTTGTWTDTGANGFIGGFATSAYISIPADNLTCTAFTSQCTVTDLFVNHTVTGANALGTRFGLWSNMAVTATTANAGTGTNFYQPAYFTAYATASEGGTGTGPNNSAGVLTGAGTNTQLRPNATNWNGAQGIEADVAVYTGATVFSRRGFMAVGYGNIHGTQDIGYEVSGGTNWTSGAWVVGLGFSNDGGGWGIDNCGALIGTPLFTGYSYSPCGATVDHKAAYGIDLTGMTITNTVFLGPGTTSVNGIDLSAGTYTGASFKGPGGFAVTPIGGVLGGGNMSTTWPSTGTTQWALIDNITNAGGEIDLINRQISPALATPTLEIIQMTGAGVGTAIGTFLYSASGDTSRLGIGKVAPAYAEDVVGSVAISAGLAVGSVAMPTAGVINAFSYQASGVVGVDCPGGVTAGTVVVNKGLVTHC